MGFLESAAELIWPTRCAGCELPGALLCQECISALARIDQRWACVRCGAPFGYLVCTECHGTEPPFSETFALAEFEHPLSRAVVLYKDEGERRLGEVLGALLGKALAQCWSGAPDVVTWVPATAQALRRRGFDHAEKVARSAACAAGYPDPELLLARGRAADQRRLGREARADNVRGTFSCASSVGGTVLLVDDVFTTGATAAAAAEVLRLSGADDVRVATLGRVW